MAILTTLKTKRTNIASPTEEFDTVVISRSFERKERPVQTSRNLCVRRRF